ncbi:hypothetical protein QQF64_011300 [Cirrhinus molitorella]|uniref:Uncharacterized protein n=1 Tax=Cirrhinus molitorella TaxID=172907 RepID=A0ABR3M1B8_9TELE
MAFIVCLIYLAAPPFWVSGESLSDRVHQNPPHLITNAEKTVNLICSHTIKDYYMILCLSFSPVLSVNMRVIIIITVTLITFSGFSYSNKVDQSPSEIIRRPGESAKIQCLHREATLGIKLPPINSGLCAECHHDDKVCHILCHVARSHTKSKS